MIANLMMYRRPQLDNAHDNFWALIRDNLHASGISAPQHLSQDAEEFYIWKNPGLVLSQTCGMPYRLWLHNQVELIGTPDYGIDGAPAGYYRSAIVVRSDDPRTHIEEYKKAVFAYNQTYSQSGYAAPYQYLKPYGFWFENQLRTEQHLRSAKSVASGRADIASLDAVSWRLMQKYEPFANQLRVLGWTEPTPGLPLIAAKGANIDKTFLAVKDAISELSTKDRSLLGIKDLVSIPKADYLSVQNPPEI